MGQDGRRMVIVFAHEGKRKPWFTAYLRDANPNWPGACTHLVDVVNGVHCLPKREN